MSGCDRSSGVVVRNAISRTFDAPPRRKQSDCGERALDSRGRWASSRINRDDGDRLTLPYPIDLSARGCSCDDNT